MSAKKIVYIAPKDAAHLNTIQDAAIKAVNSARVKVQVALVATMLHIGKHGDWTGAGRLVEGLGNTVNGRAIVEWFTTYCGLTVAEDGSGFSGIVPKHKEYILKNIEAAKEKMWWELKPANPFKGWNADEELQRFIKKHKESTAKLANLSDEDKAKVSLNVQDATIQQVLALVKFNDILAAGAANAEEQQQAA